MTSAATPIAAAAGASGLAVPTLAGLADPTPSMEGEELCAQLAIAMLDAGVARPDLWSRSWWRDKKPVDFIAAALNEFVERHGGQNVRKRFSIEATLGNRGHHSTYADAGEFVLSVNADEAAYIRLGDAARRLSRVHRHLPSTVVAAIEQFAEIFTVYDWDAAGWSRESHLEFMRECVDETGGVERLLAFETDHPPIVLPEMLRRRPLTQEALFDMSERGRGLGADVARRCFDVRRLCEQIRRAKEFREAQLPFMTDGDPLPVLLVSLEARDQICACFDEDGQHWMQYEHSPTACWGIAPTVASVRQVFGWFALAVELFAAMSRLADALPGNAKYTYKRRSHRPFVNRRAGEMRLYAVGETRGGNLFGDPGGFGADLDDDEEAA